MKFGWGWVCYPFAIFTFRRGLGMVGLGWGWTVESGVYRNNPKPNQNLLLLQGHNLWRLPMHNGAMYRRGAKAGTTDVLRLVIIFNLCVG